MGVEKGCSQRIGNGTAQPSVQGKIIHRRLPNRLLHRVKHVAKLDRRTIVGRADQLIKKVGVGAFGLIVFVIRAKSERGGQLVQGRQGQGEFEAQSLIQSNILTGGLMTEGHQIGRIPVRSGADNYIGRPQLNARVRGRTAGVERQFRPAGGRRHLELVGDFVVTEAAGIGVHLLLHRIVTAERQAIIRAVIGNQRIIEGRGIIRVAVFEIIGREAVLDAGLVFEIPKIVVLGVEIHTQVGRAGRARVVEFQPRVQGQTGP